MCRQLIDPAEWDRHQGWTLGDRLEWSNRACGMAALRMILLAYGKDAPTLTELVKLGVKHGALVERGWLHAGIADLAATFGVPGQARPVPAGNLIGVLAEAPLIGSVTERLPDDGRRGGHLIVVHGHTTARTPHDPDDPDVLIRDPSAWGQTCDRVPLSRLAASYTGRAITFPPLPGGRTAA
ncbi:hypothetical protein C1I98_30460 [Spongiactinospora gelatinilytica]|uniref:Peptidase C39 domain-containing protein n=1 Tax=Spongiactinospora gelatinilytica TaxID=2666298 RepID=A0A2W2F6L7_9ACTN|nr:papain-like cysteine protease family protein [Spongiactinospora gelatinilytica]PZG31053.1 hypothetical protein C1I98_30460 [Spongiactinospora gelatinilytica]